MMCIERGSNGIQLGFGLCHSVGATAMGSTRDPTWQWQSWLCVRNTMMKDFRMEGSLVATRLLLCQGSVRQKKAIFRHAVANAFQLLLMYSMMLLLKNQSISDLFSWSLGVRSFSFWLIMAL
jgi:hypothetical protein